MFSSSSLSMDQLMTLILKLIAYWLNIEQVHHGPRILLKKIPLFVMSRDFRFQNQMSYISINQPVTQFLGCKIFHIIFTLVYTLNGNKKIFQKVFYCANVVYIPYVNKYAYFIP